MDLISRLKQYLDTRGISVTQFADECNIPRPTASQLLAGRNKKVSDEIINKIHVAYPELSVIWLMFGEGDMGFDANIKVSEPQNTGIFGFENSEKTVNQDVANENSNQNDVTVSASEKFADADMTSVHAEHSTFSFETDDSFPSMSAATSADAPFRQEPSATMSQKGNNGKRVTGIVVYYDDNTFESFIPDPEHRHPFMR